MTIVIDPGHGGIDSGAIGTNGIKEKDITLKVAKQMLILNRTLFENKYDITLTRYRDTLISLIDRTRLTNALGPDMFISLHCNHSTNPKAQGIEVYVHNGMNTHSDQSAWLAYNLHKELNEQLGLKSRGVKFDNFQVLRETAQTCPSILIELGFLSNDLESKYYNNDHYIRALALGILLAWK